jgi:hypothetical protein
MDLRDLARIIIRVAGLIILVLAVSKLPYGVLSALGTNSAPVPRFVLSLVALMPAIASILGGLTLVASAEAIANRAFVSKHNEISPDAKNTYALEEVSVFAIGIYIITTAISDGSYYLYILLISSDNANGNTPRPMYVGLIYAFIVRFFLGVLLLMGSRSIVAFRHQLLRLRPMRDD